MATSLIGGLISNGSIEASQLRVFEPNQARAQSLAAEFGVTPTPNNAELVAQSDIVVIAVKPQVLEQVLTPLVDVFRKSSPMIISIVAGITSQSIETWLNDKYAVVRVMPNTPALVGNGASGMHANERVSDAQKSTALQLMNAVGVSAWVPSENDIDSVTALSGSGPAYFMLFIKGLIDAGVRSGLTKETAKLLAVQTAAGTAKLIEHSEDSLQTLIDNVTSPNGTTEQALKSFQESALSEIVGTAFDAAKRRSEELASELGSSPNTPIDT